jgi:hypothetical protein
MLRFEMRLRKGKRNAARDHLFSGSEAVNRGTPSIRSGLGRWGRMVDILLFLWSEQQQQLEIRWNVLRNNAAARPQRF